jgi:hypothetical protein
MVYVVGAMLGIMGISVAAFASAGSDLGVRRYDRDTKQAYAAAEAGLADYVFHLGQDNSYWTKCTNVPSPAVVNQPWNGTSPVADPRGWRSVPGSTAEYAIELLPANGQTACSEANAQGSMIDSTTGTFRIRVTGRVPATSTTRAAKRSIIATFRRRGFLDFLYFTDYETSDPFWYALDARGRQTNPDLVGWAQTNCSKYWRDGRGNQNYNGQIFWFDNQWYPWAADCTEIQFAPGDVIRGPFHTNDELLICGSPDFGRTNQDRIEVSAASPGWRGSNGCSGNNPTFVGTFAPNSPILAMPPTNTKLKKAVNSNYLFTGQTTIRLSGANMFVTNAARGLNNTSMALPSNGVVYVQNGSCGQNYDPLNPYGAPTGCADTYVKGSYNADLTIASEKDIIVNGDVTKSADKMLGLIANNFIRVYHPVTNVQITQSGVSCTNDTGTMQNVTIEAAILSLQHSFTVDNYFCGSALGTLSVTGAIAQKFRGPVGRGGNSVANGYTKNYTYDDRLGFRSPPNFLDPVQSAWKLLRQTEQTPPR